VRTDPSIAPKLKKAPAEYLLGNMVVTTSGNYSNSAFICTKSELGIERIVLGSDYPYESMSSCTGFLDQQWLSTAESQQLYETNAASLGVKV